MKNKKDIYGFFHVACMAHWKEIFQEMIVDIKKSGLLDKTKKLYICIIGTSKDLQYINYYVGQYKNISVKILGSDLKQYEFPTLIALDNHCRKNDGLVYYLHTKGASRTDSDYYRMRRKYMVDACVYSHEEIACALNNGYDIAGAAWRHGSHFTGNFRWATSDHIKKLKPISHYVDNPKKLIYKNSYEENKRLQAEFWLGYKKNINVYNMGILDPRPFFNKKIYVKNWC